MKSTKISLNKNLNNKLKNIIIMYLYSFLSNEKFISKKFVLKLKYTYNVSL